MPRLPSGLNICLDFTKVNILTHDEELKNKITSDNTIYTLYEYISVHELECSDDNNEIFEVNIFEGSNLFDLSLSPKCNGFKLSELSSRNEMWDIADQICFDIFVDMKSTQDIIKRYLDRFTNNSPENGALEFEKEICNIYY